VNISDATAYYLLRGQPVVVPRLPAKGWVRLFLNPDKFLGVGEIQSDGRVAPRRLVQEAK
jgi:tRNA pseudouridine55 synthase